MSRQCPLLSRQALSSEWQVLRRFFAIRDVVYIPVALQKQRFGGEPHARLLAQDKHGLIADGAGMPSPGVP